MMPSSRKPSQGSKRIATLQCSSRRKEALIQERNGRATQNLSLLTSAATRLLLSARDGALVGNLSFEIAQPRPQSALVQIHFCDADCAPFLRLGEHAAVLAKDSGEHPVARDVFVGTAGEI